MTENVSIAKKTFKKIKNFAHIVELITRQLLIRIMLNVILSQIKTILVIRFVRKMFKVKLKKKN